MEYFFVIRAASPSDEVRVARTFTAAPFVFSVPGADKEFDALTFRATMPSEESGILRVKSFYAGEIVKHGLDRWAEEVRAKQTTLPAFATSLLKSGCMGVVGTRQQ